MSADILFTKENLDSYLNQLAKVFRKLNGRKTTAEIILVGGAAVLANYSFREGTYDIDAMIQASSAMKDAINKVGDDNNLPTGWLNSDFLKTDSYSDKLSQYSIYYKQFGYVLNVRTISKEYLVAMKLKSFRNYKRDKSDIIGILHEEKESGNPISLDRIRVAVSNLYDCWEALSEHAIKFVSDIFENDSLDTYYKECKSLENDAKETLVEFENKYPGVLNKDKLNDIIEKLKNDLFIKNYFLVEDTMM